MSELDAFLDGAMLEWENRAYRGSAGVSEGCRNGHFRPAFLDRETGTVYLSRYPNGHAAPFHTLEGLPDEVVVARYADGSVAKTKKALIAGFLKGNTFHTRQQAADKVNAKWRE
jgi:hypothetical protein